MNLKNKKLSKEYISDYLSSDLMLSGGKNFKKYAKPGETTTLTSEHDTSVSYILNNYLFRSDNFDKKDADDILFAGCSHTFGFELPIEHVWSNVVYKEIGTLKFKNLGTCGASYQTIFQNMYAYFRNFGKPDFLFLLMPNLERYEFVDSKDPGYTEVIVFNEKNKESKAISKILTKEYITRDFVSQIRAFEDFCENSKISLYWGTWDIDLAKTLSKVPKFKRYVKIFDSPNLKDFLDYANSNGNKDNPYWESTPDGHPGIKENLIYTRAMLDAYKNDKKS